MAAAPAAGPSRRAKRLKPTQTTVPLKKVDQRNYNHYAVLSDDETTGMDDSPTPSPQKQMPPQKVPPIVFNEPTTNVSGIFNAFRNHLQDEYEIKVRDNQTYIHCKSMEDHSALVSLLKKETIEFHTFTAPTARPVRLVAKGLPVVMTTLEIQEDLNTHGLQPIKVTQLYQNKNAQKSLFLYFWLNFLPRQTQQKSEQCDTFVELSLHGTPIAVLKDQHSA
ncbi:hypothetical protein B566_EDAN010884 [Ephemera danica]|nr:hypothetical protein B566_EDAN010884 [Ephemera danica]